MLDLQCAVLLWKARKKEVPPNSERIASALFHWTCSLANRHGIIMVVAFEKPNFPNDNLAPLVDVIFRVLFGPLVLSPHCVANWLIWLWPGGAHSVCRAAVDCVQTMHCRVTTDYTLYGVQWRSLCDSDDWPSMVHFYGVSSTVSHGATPNAEHRSKGIVQTLWKIKFRQVGLGSRWQVWSLICFYFFTASQLSFALLHY